MVYISAAGLFGDDEHMFNGDILRLQTIDNKMNPSR